MANIFGKKQAIDNRGRTLETATGPYKLSYPGFYDLRSTNSWK